MIPLELPRSHHQGLIFFESLWPPTKKVVQNVLLKFSEVKFLVDLTVYDVEHARLEVQMVQQS